MAGDTKDVRGMEVYYESQSQGEREITGAKQRKRDSNA